MKVRRVAVVPHVRLDLDGVAARHQPARHLAKPSHHTSTDMASTLPVELVEEILLRVPPDEPAHLVRACIVCKAWHGILSDETFRRRYRRFHGTPPLLGYICNPYSDSTIRIVPTTSVAAASPVHALKLSDISGRKPSALDCRHGRVLIETDDCSRLQQMRQLIVWDTIAGSQHHLSLPTYPQYPYRHNYVGAVLCAKDGCDHLDCHGGPFLVVLVGMSYDNDHEEDGQTWASMYSSETGAWSSPTTPSDETNKYIDYTKPSLLFGGALYFISGGYSIVKYDLKKHELSVIHLPAALQSTILIKGNDGGLGVAAMFGASIYMWSWRIGNKSVGRWVRYRVMELDNTPLPKGNLPDLICMAEGTNTVFIGVEDTGVFTLDLKTRQVRKVGEPKTYYNRPILPYMSFNTPNY